jgi:hypothetical protein
MIERATRNSDNTMSSLALRWRSDDNADKNADWRSNALQLLVAIDIRRFDRLAWPGLAREGEARMKRVLIALATLSQLIPCAPRRPRRRRTISSWR